MLKPKISVIGAGNVGTRYAYSLILSGLARSLVILDIDKQRAEGEVMDLASCMPFISPVEISAGDYPDLKDSDPVVITAGKKQSPGQTRLDLARDNAQIFRQIIPQIVKYAPQAILLVATNPVDALTYAAYKISGKPASEVMGSGTVLDTARFRFLLSKHCDVDARNIHAYILGEHGDSEFPVWSRAMVGGILFKDYCSLCNGCEQHEKLKGIFDEVRDFAYGIIEKKGETSYGIGSAMVRITEAVLKDENSILPVSCLVEDYYGVAGVYLSLPAMVNKQGVGKILKIELDAAETRQLKKSAGILQSAIKEMGL